MSNTLLAAATGAALSDLGERLIPGGLCFVAYIPVQTVMAAKMVVSKSKKSILSQRLELRLLEGTSIDIVLYNAVQADVMGLLSIIGRLLSGCSIRKNREKLMPFRHIIEIRFKSNPDLLQKFTFLNADDVRTAISEIIV